MLEALLNVFQKGRLLAGIVDVGIIDVGIEVKADRMDKDPGEIKTGFSIFQVPQSKVLSPSPFYGEWSPSYCAKVLLCLAEHKLD